jgi:hypothetical protein
MQTIVVNRVPIVEPQFAPIIGINLEVVMAGPENSHASCPAHCKVVTSMKARPIPTRVSVVDDVTPTSHVCPSVIQICTSTTLIEVESVLHEETMAVSGTNDWSTLATCRCKGPSISGIGTSVPKVHTSMTAMLKHFNSHHAPSTDMLGSFSIAPAVQAIIVDRIPIINPQLASVV